MIRYEHSEFFWALLLLPIMAMLFFYFLSWRKNALRSFGDSHIISRLLPAVSTSKLVWKFMLTQLAFVFLILALVNPQIGTKLEEVKRKGSEIVICLDVSNSMLAQDLHPNRLQMAKRALAQLVDKLKGDKIGIVVFAGKAYVQLPVTIDYSAAKMFINSIGTHVVPVQGTAIGSAIELAMESFNFDSPSGKAIIVISDGENHEDNAVEAAAKAAKENVQVHTIGFGSPSGAPIPFFKNGVQAGFRTDKEGNTVVSRLDEDMLRQIAAAGNGMFIRASNANSGLPDILQAIQELEKAELSTSLYTDYEDRYQFFLAVALFFFLLELFLSNRKRMPLFSLNIFERK